MFKKLVINNFRIFEDKEINLGKVFTVIAGQNATGKSTILSLIDNSCEIKIKDGKTITNKPFKTQFHEIIKGSKTYDKPGKIGYILYDSSIYSIYDNDES